MIVLAGSVYKVSFDKEGEATVIFKVPSSHRDEALAVAKETEKALTIVIKEYTY